VLLLHSHSVGKSRCQRLASRENPNVIHPSKVPLLCTASQWENLDVSGQPVGKILMLFPLKNAPSHGDLHPVWYTPNELTSHSAMFAHLTHLSNTQTDKSYGMMRHIRSGKNTCCIFFPLGDRGSKKAYMGPRTGIYLPTKFGCDRSIVAGCRSRNDWQTDKQNGMTIRLALCKRDATDTPTVVHSTFVAIGCICALHSASVAWKTTSCSTLTLLNWEEVLIMQSLRNLVHIVLCYCYIGWFRKTQTVSRFNNFATVNDRKACDMSKVSEFCLQKV